LQRKKTCKGKGLQDKDGQIKEGQIKEGQIKDGPWQRKRRAGRGLFPLIQSASVASSGIKIASPKGGRFQSI
jgi:hypothetical protein